MSEDDLLRAAGRTMQEYKQCTDRLLTLEAEAERQAKLLDSVSRFLRADQERFATGGLEEVFDKKTIEFLEDLHRTREEKKRLRKYLPHD